MMSKITVVLVGVLALALVAGMGYIILRPESATAHGGGASRTVEMNSSNGREQRVTLSETGRGQGGSMATTARGGGSGQNSSANGASSRNANLAVEHDVADMETVSGTVIESDSEILVRTVEGDEVLVGLGQAWYREQAGFAIAVGDEVTVVGFYEDGEFKAATVENSTTGAAITLRDATGRPAWAGQGNLRNSKS